VVVRALSEWRKVFGPLVSAEATGGPRVTTTREQKTRHLEMADQRTLRNRASMKRTVRVVEGVLKGDMEEDVRGDYRCIEVLSSPPSP